MKPRPIWAALILGGCMLAAVHLLFRGDLPEQPAPVPAEVAVGDQEVAFLNPATMASTWERVVAGLRHLQRTSSPGTLLIDDSQAYPKSTAALPAVALRRKDQPGTLWLRWYKLTGQNSIPVWLEALTRRATPPLAVLGGGSSDRAKELAEGLAVLRKAGRATPVLLLTTATAEYVAPIPDSPPPLMRIYDGQTFRFSFSNRQMARATLDFLWSQPLLKPRPGLICFLSWKDDPFTQDLAYQFRDLLWERYSDVFLNIEIPHSIGPLHEPNGGERYAVRKLLEELQRVPAEKPVLLVMPGGPVPVRRVLRDIFRSAPAEATRLIVTVGDAIDFNTIVRDRALSWNIQDVPCPLVMFCHRHPMCGRTDPQWKEARQKPERLKGLSSTQDLLLYADIGDTLVRALFSENGLTAPSGTLAQRLLQVRDGQGRMVFQNEQPSALQQPESLPGNRRYEAPQFLVLLQPVRQAGQVLPWADLYLFEHDTTGWQRRSYLRVPYEDGAVPHREGRDP